MTGPSGGRTVVVRAGARIPERAFALIAFVPYAALTLWTTLHHEAWFDEADPWLMMRDGGIVTLFRETRLVGMPALWHLAVWPFAASGAPYEAQQLLNLLFCWIGTWLFLRYAPFPRLVRGLFAFSYYAAFEYAVLARPYALLMMLLFVVAALWSKRVERPVAIAVAVALLANTSGHGLIIAAVAGAMFLVERLRDRAMFRPRNAAAIALMLAGGLASLAQIWPSPETQKVRYLVDVETIWYSIATAFFVDMRVESALVPSLLVLGLIVFAIGRHAIPTAFLSLSWALLLALYVFVWMGGPRHAGILLGVALAAIWMADSYGALRRERLAMAGLAVALAWSIVPMFRATRDEARAAYSGSRELAEFVRGSGLEHTILVRNAPFRHAFQVYLPDTPVWHASTGRFGSYATWDRRWQESLSLPAGEVIERAGRGLAGRRWLLLTTAPLPAEKSKGFRLLFSNRREIWARGEERYWLYEPVAGR